MRRNYRNNQRTSKRKIKKSDDLEPDEVIDNSKALQEKQKQQIQNEKDVNSFWDEMHSAGLYAGDESSWNRDQVDKALAIHSKYSLSDGGAWNNLRELNARNDTLRSQERLEELLGGMTEMMAAQAEALAKKLPYQQPAQNASAEYSASQAQTAQKQLMRRGLLSLTRWGGGNSSAGGVAGKSSNLGATV